MGFLEKTASKDNTSLGAHENGSIYLKRGRINRATFGENVPIGSKGTIADVIVELDLDTGRGFDKSTNIVGWFKKTNTAHGEISVGLGSLFKVKQLVKATSTDTPAVLGRAGIEAADLDEKAFNSDSWKSMFSEAVKDMVGEEVVYLEFAAYRKQNGKTGYDVYDIFYSVGDEDDDAQKAADALYNSFMKQVEGGWVTRYDPTLVETQEEASPMPEITYEEPKF